MPVVSKRRSPKSPSSKRPASGILPIYSRTPTLLAMTAAGIDYLSDGRCMLGLGASGPQVIVNALNVGFMAQTTADRVKTCDELRNIVDTL